MVRFHSLEPEELVLRHHTGLCDNSLSRLEEDGPPCGVLGQGGNEALQGSVALQAGEWAEETCGSQQREGECSEAGLC